LYLYNEAEAAAFTSFAHHSTMRPSSPTTTTIMAEVDNILRRDTLKRILRDGADADDVSDIPEVGSTRKRASDAGLSVVSCSSASANEPSVPRQHHHHVMRLNLDLLVRQEEEVISANYRISGATDRDAVSVNEFLASMNAPQLPPIQRTATVVTVAGGKPPLVPKPSLPPPLPAPPRRRHAIVRLDGTRSSSSGEDFDTSEVFVANVRPLPPPMSSMTRQRKTPPPSTEPVPDPLPHRHSMEVSLGNVVTSSQSTPHTPATIVAMDASRSRMLATVAYFIFCAVCVTFVLGMLLLQVADSARQVRLATYAAVGASIVIDICVCVHAIISYARSQHQQQQRGDTGAGACVPVCLLLGFVALSAAILLSVLSTTPTPATVTAMSMLRMLALILPSMAEFALLVRDCGSTPA